VGERFRGAWFPWALVASNVGAEGIDLQTYTSHLVHYEIEWNPARMEQREGRGDRLGRRLRSRLKVYFPLVAKSYEERMLHQLVARMRWHGVLLGKAGVDLVHDDGRRIYRPTDASELVAAHTGLGITSDQYDYFITTTSSRTW
jgi:superfamily II DNA/RNA helicase